MSMATVRTKDSFDHWWDAEGRKKIVLYRRSLRASTSRYVEKLPCIEGVPDDYEAEFTVVSKLAKSYVALVRGELAHHDGDPHVALWTGMLFGPLFTLMWDTASRVPFRAIDVPPGNIFFRGDKSEEHLAEVSAIVDFTAKLPEYQIDDWIAIETLETAEILARAYVKAFAEFHYAARQQEVMVVRHHSALLAELIGDMLNLVLMGGEQTDQRLPDNHLHKRLAIQQEALRAPRAPKIWF
jgi:hypothetical protein